MGQTNRNSKIGCATRVESKKAKYPQTLLLKVHYETSVPTVLDRFIQQAVMQVLQRRWDPTFSEYSYGFRPGRSAHQAVAQAQAYVAAGHHWVVDIDLEKFFDRVNQDRLMARVAERVSDKRVLTLIRAFLKAGVMENGLVSPT